MLRLIGFRLLATVPVLLLVSFAVFMLMSLLPGDPAIALAGGPSATPEAIDEVRARLNLDDPLLLQYVRWLGDVIRLDLGESLLTGRSISADIAERLPVTVGLAAAATVVAIVIGIPLGVVSGLWPGRAIDGAVRTAASAGIAIPSFWLAVMMVSLFAVQLGWLPPTGYVPLTESPLRWLQGIAMPAFALGVAVAASLARQLRRALIDVMESNYIRTAWAKGADTKRVVVRHAFKNAAVPAVTILGVQVGYLLGGTVIIEQIFAIPGLGRYMIEGIYGSDLPVVQGVVLVFVIFQVGMSLLVDISYGFLNPKVRVA